MQDTDMAMLGKGLHPLAYLLSQWLTEDMADLQMGKQLLIEEEILKSPIILKKLAGEGAHLQLYHLKTY